MREDMEVMREAARQHGVVSRERALANGMSRSAVHRRTKSGVLLQLHPGILRAAGAPVTWRSEVFAAVMWAGADAFASHRTAGALWQLDGVEAGALEVTVPRRQALRRHGVVVHRGLAFGPGHRVEIDGIPTAAIGLTLLQLASVLRPDSLATALDSALVQGLTRPDRVLDVVDSIGRRGRRGAGHLVELLGERMDGQRPYESRFERRLAAVLQRGGLPRAVRQLDVVVDVRFVARPDLSYPELRIAIEADSHRWHSARSAWERDLDRRSELAAAGWLVLHFSWRKLVSEPEYVVRKVREARAARMSAA